jgi:lysophospholipase L1-like esterase
MRLIRTIIILLGVSFCAVTTAQTPQEKGPQKWETQIAAFEREDGKQFPLTRSVLFVGSSSIRMWDVKRFFPDVPVINRGFGGSEYSDAAHFVDRIVIPYRPATLVLYSGDNDLAKGKSSSQVLTDVCGLIEQVQVELPRTRVVVIAIKPSIARWKLIESIRETNQLIREWAATRQGVVVVDVEASMLGDDGRPRKELFQKDGLHLTDEGYAVWTALVRPHLTWGELEDKHDQYRWRRGWLARRCCRRQYVY